MDANLLLWLVGLPLAGSVVLYFSRGKLQDILALLLPLAYLVLGLLAVFSNLAAFPLSICVTLFPWLGESGSLCLRLDALASILLIVVLIIGFFVMAFSIPYMGPRNKDHPVVNREGNSRYYFFMSLFIAAMVGVALAKNLLVFVVFWELTTLCSWALISHHLGRNIAARAGFKALAMTQVGGVFLFAATAVVFGVTGNFDFSAIKELSPAAQVTVFFFVLAAATAKSAQVPLFTWLPDAMEAPTPVSAYLHAAAMVKAGVYLMARAILESGLVSDALGGITAGLALVTTIIALIFYFYQDDLKRFLAFSTIAQLGYIMLGLSTYMLGSKTGYMAGVFHIACHSAAKALLFLCVGFIAMRLGVKSFSKVSGLYQKMPVTAVCFLIGLLAVTGVPPFSCFWSKMMLIMGVLDIKNTVLLWLLAVPLVLEIVVAFFWFLRVGHGLLFGSPSQVVQEANHDGQTIGTGWVNAILLGLAVLTVVMPAVAYPLLKMLL